MGYRNNFGGFSSTHGSQLRGAKAASVDTEASSQDDTLEAYFKRNDDKDRFTTMYTKSFTQQSAPRLRLGSLQPLQEQSTGPNRAPFAKSTEFDASIRPGSTGFASSGFDSNVFDVDRPTSGASLRRTINPCDSRSSMSTAAMLGHSQSDSLLRPPQQMPRARGGGLLPLTRCSSAQSDSQTAWGMAASSLLNRRPESQQGDFLPDGLGELRRPDSQAGLRRPDSQSGSRRPDSQAGGVRPGSQAGRNRRPESRAALVVEESPTRPNSGDGGSSSSEATGDRKRSKVETRRTVVEFLSNPDLKRIAREKFDRHDPTGSGHLGFTNYRSVLGEMHSEFGLETPDYDMAERLFKKFDVDYSRTLDFTEFFELLLGLLRQNAFDRSAIFGRDFFVQKHQGSVWERYEKMSELGSGMFGTAYLVKQRFTGEQQVVKVVRKSRVQIPVEDVEREILMLRQLDHPHVVRLRRWYEDKQSVYLLMDFLPGGSLKDKLSEVQRQNSGLKERWIRTLVQQVLQGMSYCHGLRLIHKDLKDENIMLLNSKSPDPEKEPFAVIIDLGMAELFSPMDPQCRHVGGTPVTMAPQVWTGTFGPKCDVWSLGCVFYQLLVGRVPFYCQTMNPESWIKEQKSGADWSLVKTSRAGRDLCKAMLTFSEEDRPSMATCLQHKWFNLEKKELTTIKPAQFAYLQEEYVRGSALKRALLLELASALPMDDADRIVDIFKDFDVNNDGKVSLQEVKDAFRNMGCPDDRLAEKTFQALDLDQDGELSFTEFSSWLLLGFEDLMEDRLYKMLMEYNDNPDSKALDNDGVKRFLMSLESMLKKGSIGRSSSLLKELRSGRHDMIPYEELKQRLLGPSSKPLGRSVTGALVVPPPDPVETSSLGETSNSSAAVQDPVSPPRPTSAMKEWSLSLNNRPGSCASPPGKNRSRIGINQSLQRLRSMYSRK